VYKKKHGGARPTLVRSLEKEKNHFFGENFLFFVFPVVCNFLIMRRSSHHHHESSHQQQDGTTTTPQKTTTWEHRNITRFLKQTKEARQSH
jgi:hypothetical protein